MTSNRSWGINLAQAVLALAIVVALVAVHGTEAQDGPVHLTTDWSHKHLIFSRPKGLMQQFELSSNPRFVHQWIRRNAEKRGEKNDKENERRWRRFEPNPLHADWNAYLGISSGGAAGTVGAGMSPAKFSFDATAAANCASATRPDFVVYNTSLAGSTTALAARDTGTFAGEPAVGETITITNGVTTLTLTAVDSPNTGTNFIRSANTTTQASNLVATINRAGNGSSVNVTASSSVATVTVTATGASVGTAGNSITVGGTATGWAWSFNNFVDGATGVPTIVAYDNLYTSCVGTVPSTYWAYNTGTGDSIVTSPVLSRDGTQVAVVQNVGTGAQLVLLKWAASSGTVNSPITLATQAPAAYRSCSAPCLLTITFSGAASNDTNSSPFYDYFNDVLYVGDNGGLLHKFTGVFNGTPAEVVSTGTNIWPAVVSTHPLTVLTSPVFDDGSGQIFVCDNSQFLYRVSAIVGSGSGGIVSTVQLGTFGIDDAVLLDVTTNNVYVFVRLDANGANGRAGICQFSTSFLSSSGCVPGTNEAQVSSDNASATPFYAGNFDDLFYSSTGGTGNLYACSTNAGLPALWSVPVSNGTLGAPVAGPTLATVNVNCSPVTEFKNGTTDRMFVSVTASSVTGGVVNCPAPSGGCIMSYDITTTAGWGTSKATTATAAVPGGASAVVIDNLSGTGGASQIYFTPLSTTARDCTTPNQIGIGGCAIQASQSALN